MTPTYVPLTLDYRDFFYVAPEIVLIFWGLLVLLVDLALARRLDPRARQRTAGLLALAGVGFALITALIVAFVPLSIRGFPDAAETRFNADTIKFFIDDDPVVFFGTIAGDVQSSFFNILYLLFLGLVVWMSTAWKFTEEWGEYLALMFWATVGMMLLTASEELVTLFVTLETMTICLYLCTALEKTKRRSAEGAFKYFVYGSVSSALFLFGLSLLFGLTGTTQFGAIRTILASAVDAEIHNQTGFGGLSKNVAGAAAVLLMLVGFGFKVAAVPFHQWAPEAYEGAPAPVSAWIATGSKLASFVAFMKVFALALLPWAVPTTGLMGPGWVAVVAVISAVTMTYGNFAALAQRNLKRMLAYSSIAHAGYILVGVAAIGVSIHDTKAAAAVLYYLVVYAFANIGAFAVAVWLVRDKDSDNIDDLNGVGFQEPLLATCILVLMLSLIGIPPLAGFFGKVYLFMEALDQRSASQPVTLIWLVALGLFNSVVSAFYYVRVLKAMFLRNPGAKRLAPPGRPIAVPIVIGTVAVVVLGLWPESLMNVMQGGAVAMLTDLRPQGQVTPFIPQPPGQKASARAAYTPEQLRRMGGHPKGLAPAPPQPHTSETPAESAAPASPISPAKSATPGKTAP